MFEELDRNLHYCNNVTFLRLPSALACRLFKDKSLDLVYIDGWHNVLAVFTDILSWLPKVKPHGFIGGHDFREDHNSQVIPAVRFTLTSPDYLFPDSSWLKRTPMEE